MTREEAARRFSEKMADPYYVPRLRELYQMAADALSEPPVVRCKDCIWWSKYAHRADGVCTYISGDTGERFVSDDGFFCANGKRRV